MFRKHYDKLVQWQNMLADVQVYFAFFNILTVNSLLNVDKHLIRVLVKFAFNFFNLLRTGTGPILNVWSFFK